MKRPLTPARLWAIDNAVEAEEQDAPMLHDVVDGRSFVRAWWFELGAFMWVEAGKHGDIWREEST